MKETLSTLYELHKNGRELQEFDDKVQSIIKRIDQLREQVQQEKSPTKKRLIIIYENVDEDEGELQKKE